MHQSSSKCYCPRFISMYTSTEDSRAVGTTTAGTALAEPLFGLKNNNNLLTFTFN